MRLHRWLNSGFNPRFFCSFAPFRGHSPAASLRPSQTFTKLFSTLSPIPGCLSPLYIVKDEFFLLPTEPPGCPEAVEKFLIKTKTIGVGAEFGEVLDDIITLLVQPAAILRYLEFGQFILYLLKPVS